MTLIPSLFLMAGCVIVSCYNGFLAFVFSLIIPFLFTLNVILGVFWLITRNKFFLLSILSLIVYFFFFDSFVQFNSLKESINSDNLSILSYNANGFKYDGKDGNREGDDKIADFIIKKKPDIVCFQEFSAIKYKPFKDYPHWFKTNLVTSGKSVMAMFSKYPIVTEGYVDFPDSRNQAIYADIKFNKKIIRVYNIHLESFKLRPKSSYLNVWGVFKLTNRVKKVQAIQEEQAKIIIEHANSFKGKVVFVGDFNATQYSNTYRKLSHNMLDSFIESGRGFGGTYPRLNYPFRIDYILVDKNIEVLSHENFKLKLSDHEPILVNLAID